MVGGDAEHRFRRLVQRFERMFRKPGQGGGALAVYWQGEKVVDVWAGYADPIGQRPWQADTASMSFSTTKGVASTAVHRLVDRGLLAYDEPLGSYWDAFNAPERRHVTLRKVLSHQAGLHRIRGVVPAAEDLLDGAPRVERGVRHLEDDLDAAELLLAALGGQGRQRLAAEPHGAAGGWQEAEDRAQQGALARTVWTDDAHRGARRHSQVDVADDRSPAVSRADVA
jgi:CubicO group peptidase (beta-lactamase class C family)